MPIGSALFVVGVVQSRAPCSSRSWRYAGPVILGPRKREKTEKPNEASHVVRSKPRSPLLRSPCDRRTWATPETSMKAKAAVR